MYASLPKWLQELLPEVSVDETFATARAELAQFTNIEPVDPPASFEGVLKPIVFAERRGTRAVGFVGPAFVPAAGTLAGRAEP